VNAVGLQAPDAAAAALQIGDVLLAAAFVSYAGPFNMALRSQLVEERWLPDLIDRKIPLSEGVRPLDLLTDDSARAKWANEGLPIDPLSVENGAIMTNASRWSLMIDPQLQVRTLAAAAPHDLHVVRSAPDCSFIYSCEQVQHG
jgi:hypothetical protein